MEIIIGFILLAICFGGFKKIYDILDESERKE